MSKKGQLGGSGKWALPHLPPGTSQLFTLHVARRARVLAGTLGPWDALPVENLQQIVDDVFGDGVHTVEENTVWYGLIITRLSNWRNGFVRAAKEAFNRFKVDHPDAMSTPEQVAQIVTLYLSKKGDPEHSPFWWREWDQDMETKKITKKGIFQNWLIMQTLAHGHFVEYGENIPEYSSLSADERPAGALVLALQAVEHVLKAWSTGVFVEPTTSATFFSSDNYGDYIKQQQRSTGTSSKLVTISVPRATFFYERAKGLGDSAWAQIFDTATEFLGVSRKRKRSIRSRSISSRASSPGPPVEVEMPNYSLVSDDDEE